MPRENKKRGRRAETQSKSFGNEHVTISKRQKHDQGDSDFHDQHDYVPLDHDEDGEPTTTKPFYGLLDEEEQELFRNAMDTLNFHMDEFSEPGDLQEWVKKMYQHAKGKELKLANSQSCSRFMEMLIQLSTPEQLKGLIQSFSSKYVRLLIMQC
jgi:nucleolar protein 9